jgi:hypothetical protein
MTEQEKYAEKIAKLLALAESTTNPGEAEVFTAKAQELMTQYAISEAMVREREGKPREEIIEGHIIYSGTYAKAYAEIGIAIARQNNCKPLIGETYVKQALKTDSNRTRMVKGSDLHVIGFESDVARVKLLDSSLHIQCSIALTNWVKEGHLEGLWDANEKTRARREFIYGFASGVREKLREARIKGQQEATAEEAERAEVSVDEASESVGLILRSRKDQVNDWYDEQWGGRTRSSRRSYRMGNASASGAGRSAGLSANTSTNGLKGNAGQLGRG